MSPSELIDSMGGTAKVAALCEVSMAAVSQWRDAGIPKSRLMFLRLACPEAFKDLSSHESISPMESEPQ